MTDISQPLLSILAVILFLCPAQINAQNFENDSIIAFEVGLNLFSWQDNPLESTNASDGGFRAQARFFSSASFKLIKNRLNLRMDAGYSEYSQDFQQSLPGSMRAKEIMLKGTADRYYICIGFETVFLDTWISPYVYSGYEFQCLVYNGEITYYTFRDPVAVNYGIFQTGVGGGLFIAPGLRIRFSERLNLLLQSSVTISAISVYGDRTVYWLSGLPEAELRFTPLSHLSLNYRFSR